MAFLQRHPCVSASICSAPSHEAGTGAAPDTGYQQCLTVVDDATPAGSF